MTKKQFLKWKKDDKRKWKNHKKEFRKFCGTWLYAKLYN